MEWQSKNKILTRNPKFCNESYCKNGIPFFKRLNRKGILTSTSWIHPITRKVTKSEKSPWKEIQKNKIFTGIVIQDAMVLAKKDRMKDTVVVSTEVLKDIL